MARILIAEDSPTQAERLIGILEGEGHEVTAVRDGQTALATWSASSFDLVISDIVMPGLSGYELCRQIKSAPNGRGVPVMLLTTLSEPMDIISGLECGADNFVTKPYRKNLLIERIERILEHRDLRLGARLDVGVEIMFLGKRFTITSEKEQILDLLLSTFEDTVRTNRELRLKEQELARAKAELENHARTLENRVRERTAELEASNRHLEGEIAERERIQASELQAQARFRFLFAHNPLPMWVYDLETLRFLEVNDTASAKYGYSPAEFAEMRISDIRPAEDLDRLAENMEKGRTVFQHSGPWRHRKRDGGIIDVEISSHEILWDRRRAALVVAEDITERVNLEQQLRQVQKMEAVGRLTGGIAHDFNNLLGIITGNLDLLSERLTHDPESAELAEEALNGALRGAELTQRMLAFARKQPLQPRNIDLNEVLPGMTTMLRRMLREDIVVNMQPAEGLWLALCDKSQVEDAVLNLAINARDAMPDGGKLLIETANVHLDEDYVARHAEVAAGDYVMLAVTDSGTGMPADVIDRAFEPFFTTKPTGHGTGLGLSMVYGFAKQSGGHVKIYSEVGHGTTIKLYLPKADSRERDSADSDHNSEAAPSADHETIMIVEDNAELRTVAVKLLKDLGYTVHDCDNAQSALEILKDKDDIDLVFSDVVMPGGMTGFELAKAVKELRPNVKVLLTTGYSEIFVKNDHAHRGDVDVISKPYRKHDLAVKIRSILKKA